MYLCIHLCVCPSIYIARLSTYTFKKDFVCFTTILLSTEAFERIVGFNYIYCFWIAIIETILMLH